MEEFYLKLDGGQLRMVEDEGQIRFETAALHLDEPQKITSITFFLNDDELNKLGEWIKNARLQKED